MLTVSKPVVVEDNVLTVEVSSAVRSVITEWEHDHVEDLNHRLEQFGLRAYDLTVPTYYRVVTSEDLKGEVNG